MTRAAACVLFITAGLLNFGNPAARAQGTSVPDSGFVELSMEELQNAKAYYLQELDALAGEKKELIQKGIEDGERLLPGADPKVIFDITIRLADLYYHKEKDAYLDRMKAYEDSLEQKAATKIPEPRLAFPKALEYYQKIIDAIPACDLADDAMYYKAYLLEETGESQEANALYLQIDRLFPQSSYLPEAYMRLGEYFFNSPENRLDQAIEYFLKAAKFQDSPRHPEALYKLGWSYYRLNRYAESISYFTALVEQFTAGEKTQSRDVQSGTDLRNEAIDYMAIAFADYGGPAKANGYLIKIGKPDWGKDVLRKMGDLYRIQKEEYPTALTAYGLLLDYVPFYSEAPQVQKYVADCYRDMGDPDRAFEARHGIFLQFRVGSTWWNQNPDEKNRLQAYRLGEQALRENVSELVKKAEFRKSETLYLQAADMAQAYLQAYPEDLNALLVRWNRALILDSKLRRYADALQEYLTISMVYDTETYQSFARDKGLATLQDAALNAMVVADTLVQREYKKGARQGGPAKSDAKESVPLMDAEKWLVMAYDNYIKLFPFETKTPVVLANAGALFYTHNQYNEALRYFRTLTKTFPESDQVKNVQLYILESYFGKGDFESAEALSKKLLGGALSEQDQKAVQKRLAEAIFMRGKAFSDQNQPAQAAAEFFRMALEVPTAEFADRAVFNAGREFEKVHDYASAIRSYELLRASYGGSNLMPDGLNNLAINYAATGDSLNAAARYEELSKILKDQSEAEAALTNAFVHYSHAKSWRRAVETGETFSSLYPQSPNGATIWFRTAEGYALLNDDLRSARKYVGLAVRFPLSPTGVEANFRAGLLYQKMDSLVSAEKAYDQAYRFHEALVQKGMPGNAYFASEGLFQSSLLLENRYDAVSFILPQNVFLKNQDEKLGMLRQLVEHFARVSTFQTHRVPEALFRIGRVNEKFALTWASQEIPVLEPTVRAVKQKEINAQSVRLTRQALSAYLAASGAMAKRMQNADPAVKGSVPPDTVKALFMPWIEKAKTKASEQVFRMAEISAATFRELLNAPVPADLGELARLEYRSQVLIKAVMPLALATVEEHRRNLALSDSLEIKGGWADSSRVRILASTGFLAAEFEKLAFTALDGYRSRMAKYRNDVRKEAKSPIPETTNAMVNFLDLAKTYSGQALAFRKNELVQAFQMGLLPAGIQAEARATSRFALSMDDSLESIKRQAGDDREWAARLFENGNDPKVEEWLAVFEDNVFFAGESRKSVLEQAYAVLKAMPEPSPEGGLLAVRLVQYAPDVYAAKLNMPLENVLLEPDSTWIWSVLEHPGWEKPGFRAMNWLRFSGTFAGDSALIKETTAKGGVGPFHAGDSTLAAVHQKPGRTFVRKEFSLGGIPVSADGELPGDACGYYVNGMPLASKAKPEVVLNLLHRGENVFAFCCARYKKCRFAVRIIPDRLLPNPENSRP